MRLYVIMVFTVTSRIHTLNKPATMTQGSGLSRDQQIYRKSAQLYRPFVLTNSPVFKTPARVQGYSYAAHRCASTDRSGSSVVRRRRAAAVGKSQIQPGTGALYATSTPGFVRTALNSVRNVGGTAPPKTRGYVV